MAVSSRPAVSIRRHRYADLTLSDLTQMGTLEVRLASLLRAAVRARKNIVVSGAMNSGKTTMLRALAAEIPPRERIVTIEQAFELGLDATGHRHPDMVALEARPANLEGEGQISVADLVRRALRMNADRVIVGEVLGDEVLPMLNAMSQGRSGSMCTIHADSSSGVFRRIASYAVQAPERLPLEATNLLIAGAVHLVVHLDSEMHDAVDVEDPLGDVGPRTSDPWGDPGRNWQFPAMTAAEAVRLLGPGGRGRRGHSGHLERDRPARTGPARGSRRTPSSGDPLRAGTVRIRDRTVRCDRVPGMNSAVAAASGLGFGLGVVGIVLSRRRRGGVNPSKAPRTVGSQAGGRWYVLVAVGAAVAVGAGMLTGWVAAVPITALAVYGVPALFGRTATSVSIVKLEAIATWTEMLQSTMAASAGLGQAIISTAPLSPPAIRGATGRLSSRLGAAMHPRDALSLFADELDDSCADRVVCALQLAATARAQRLGELLAALADSTRDEVALRLRIETSRASVRSGVRTVLVFSIAFAAALTAGAHAYLQPFDSMAGQGVLLVVGGLYATGLTLMVSLAKPPVPVRLLGRQVTEQ